MFDADAEGAYVDGRRVGTYYTDPTGRRVLAKGLLLEKHHYRHPVGWGTDRALLEALGDDGYVEFSTVDGRGWQAPAHYFWAHARPVVWKGREQLILPDKWWMDPRQGEFLTEDDEDPDEDDDEEETPMMYPEPSPQEPTPESLSVPAAWKGAALEVRLVSLESLEPSRFQPAERAEDSPSLRALAASLDLYGQLQPILVHLQGARYGVLDGHRRRAAAARLGWAELQALVNPAITTETQALQAIQEVNLQRLGYTAASALAGMQASGVDWDTYASMSTTKMQHMLARWTRLFPDPVERMTVYQAVGSPYALAVATKLRTYLRWPPDRMADVVRWLAINGEGQLKRLRAVPDAQAPARRTLAHYIDEKRPLPRGD